MVSESTDVLQQRNCILQTEKYWEPVKLYVTKIYRE